MKKTWMKIGALVLTIIVCLSVLTACGGAAVENASGSHGALTWSFTAENKTLTVVGSGDMADFESAAAVSWASVRTAVHTVVVGEGITGIGNYAFYGMTSLKEVRLPSTLTEIRDLSFAFCSALPTIELKEGITSLGTGAFEGCSALTKVFTPESVTSIGERCFAYCNSLKTVLIGGAVAEGSPEGTQVKVGAQAFYNCGKIENLALREGVVCEANTFQNASKSASDAVTVTNAKGIDTVTVRYMKDGDELTAQKKTIRYNFGDNFHIATPAIEGYTPDQVAVKGSFFGIPQTFTVNYYKNEAPATPEQTPSPENTPEAQEPADEPISATTIVAIVIMAVVLVGIGVGAFLLMRSDKKGNKNKTTVRKNDTGKNGKSKK